MKIRIEPFRVYGQFLAFHRNMERRADAVVPRFFLMQVVSDVPRAAACEQVTVFGKDEGGAVTLSGGSPQVEPGGRRILEVHTGSDEPMVQGAVIGAQSQHPREILHRCPRVFSVCTRHALAYVAFLRTVTLDDIAPLRIVVPVVVQSCRQLMPVAKFAFIKQGGIDVRFIYVIYLVRIVRLLVVVRA